MWGVKNVNWAEARRDGLNLFTKLIRTKDPGEDNTQETSPKGRSRLPRCLSTLDLTSLGVGSCVGTGMYLVSGMVARNFAGPGVIFSFMIAAVASIFSGACYAEFGVRVPNTTGSAYTYSYVSVGEFIAFVIGWNMILEYMIGTSACSRALSACIHSLQRDNTTRQLPAYIGTWIGFRLDYLAFGITILMTLVLVTGVRKSLIFTHILNAINLSTWVFMMAAGLFYIDFSNWGSKRGFLPYGWGGVFSGAATCFYAFIGFDIIATTGEEANDPKRSIPLAIVLSLAIILGAYITCSMMLTLIVPYDEVNPDAALIEMFGHVNAPTCKNIVGTGAIAGLTVSMFGSMFPMPRVIYAMAQDGLIFKCLGTIWERTGTPALATLAGGFTAAIFSLFIQLDILVEMMSIGTLLAYTLVATCVLVLRYQPYTTNLIELLPQNLRTPAAITAGGSGQQETGFMGGTGTRIVPPTQRVMVRRVTRSSPDSDDTIGGDEDSDEYGRDDTYLVTNTNMDRSETKYYVIPPASAATHRPCAAFCDALCYRLQAMSYLCPGLCPWVEPGMATEDSGFFVTKLIGVFFALVIPFDLFAAYGNPGESMFTNIMMILLLIAMFLVLLIISRKPENRKNLVYATPGLPFIPAIAIGFNIYLILNLSVLTLIRFTIWMALGLIMYFKYGIKNSKLAQVRKAADQPKPPVPGILDRITLPTEPQPPIVTGDTNIFQGDGFNFNPGKYSGASYSDPLAAWDEPEPRTTMSSNPINYTQVEQRYNPKTNTSFAVAAGRPPWAETTFPTWDY